MYVNFLACDYNAGQKLTKQTVSHSGGLINYSIGIIRVENII